VCKIKHFLRINKNYSHKFLSPGAKHAIPRTKNPPTPHLKLKLRRNLFKLRRNLYKLRRNSDKLRRPVKFIPTLPTFFLQPPTCLSPGSLLNRSRRQTPLVSAYLLLDCQAALYMKASKLLVSTSPAYLPLRVSSLAASVSALGRYSFSSAMFSNKRLTLMPCRRASVPRSISLYSGRRTVVLFLVVVLIDFFVNWLVQR